MDQPAEPVRESDGAAYREVSLPWYESLAATIAPGHEIQLLESGHEYFPALLSAIAAAQTSIYLETYIFGDDTTALRVARALVAAAERGVAVQCVVDGFGTPRLSGEVAQVMSSPTLRLETFRPDGFRFSLNRRRLRRLHRKLVVIDGEQVFVGGINLIDDLRDPHHGVLNAPRLDFAVRVRGPLVANAHLAVTRLWWELTTVNRSLRKPRPSGSHPPARKSFKLPEIVRSTVTPVGKVRAALMLRDNFRHRRAIERWYLRAIAHAKTEIFIANAYFLPGVRFRRALIAAVKRGVRVRLLLQGKVEYRFQHWATQALYDRLLTSGIEIVEYQPSFLHAKVAVIDSQATVGSSNIDPFSLLLAREANVVIDDDAFARVLHARLDRAVRDGGKLLELSEHRRRPLPQRVMNWFAFVLLRLAVSVTGRAGHY